MLNEIIAKGLDDSVALRKRSRILPIFIALFGTGAGHMFVGHHRRGILWFVVQWVFSAMVIVSFITAARVMGGSRAVVVLMAPVLLIWLAAIIDLARVRPDRYGPFRAGPFVGFVVATVVVGSLLSMASRYLVVEVFKIPSASGYPTLVVGDHVFVDKWHYRMHEPARGEIAAYESPEHEGQMQMHRVLGLPGDEMQIRQGHPTINGWSVPHCSCGRGRIAYESAEGTEMSTEGEVEVEFLDGHAYLTFYDEAIARNDRFPNSVPHVVHDGEYFVVGDNRLNSYDSRMWFGGQGGSAPRDLFKGSAMFIWANWGPEKTRAGAPLADPVLPTSLASLAPTFDACMKARPPREATVPPLGRGRTKI